LPGQADAIYETLVLSNLIGRANVKHEIVEKIHEFSLRGNGIQFDELPDILDRALEWFVSKGVITKEEFVKLSAELRWQSFTVARTGETEILDQIKAKLTEALKSGIGIDEFKADIDKVFDAVGVSRLNPWHLDTVYQTNTFSGYGEGRKQIVDELSIDEFPLRQIVTVGDDRVRDEHAELDGFTAPKDDPVWEWLKTPFSYRCRCKIMPVHVSEGLSPSGYVPDVRGKRGFEFVS
jgi:SPP1 gp7 family putative phage head morphogenesis protein